MGVGKKVPSRRRAVILCSFTHVFSIKIKKWVAYLIYKSSSYLNYHTVYTEIMVDVGGYVIILLKTKDRKIKLYGKYADLAYFLVGTFFAFVIKVLAKNWQP